MYLDLALFTRGRLSAPWHLFLLSPPPLCGPEVHHQARIAPATKEEKQISLITLSSG